MFGFSGPSPGFWFPGGGVAPLLAHTQVPPFFKERHPCTPRSLPLRPYSTPSPCVAPASVVWKGSREGLVVCRPCNPKRKQTHTNCSSCFPVCLFVCFLSSNPPELVFLPVPLKATRVPPTCQVTVFEWTCARRAGQGNHRRAAGAAAERPLSGVSLSLCRTLGYPSCRNWQWPRTSRTSWEI